MASSLSSQVGMTSINVRDELKSIAALRLRSDGFTLIELIVAIAILATLVGIAVPLFASYADKARVARTIAEMKSMETEILVFDAENGRLPDALAEIGLGALKDPYGNAYQYIPATSEEAGAKKGKMRKDRSLHPVNTDFDLYSMGKDGKSAAAFTAKISQDDIVRASNGRFFGLVSEY